MSLRLGYERGATYLESGGQLTDPRKEDIDAIVPLDSGANSCATGILSNAENTDGLYANPAYRKPTNVNGPLALNMRPAFGSFSIAVWVFIVASNNAVFWDWLKSMRWYQILCSGTV